MKDWFRKFRTDEGAAVTVDWVVLTAAIIGISLLIVFTIKRGATQTSGAIGNQLSTAMVPTIDF